MLTACWAIGPAVWFWYEYHYMIVVDAQRRAGLEAYKFGVQLGAAIWAAAAVSLGAYISSDHFKEEKKANSAAVQTATAPAAALSSVKGTPKE